MFRFARRRLLIDVIIFHASLCWAFSPNSFTVTHRDLRWTMLTLSYQRTLKNHRFFLSRTRVGAKNRVTNQRLLHKSSVAFLNAARINHCQLAPNRTGTELGRLRQAHFPSIPRADSSGLWSRIDSKSHQEASVSDADRPPSDRPPSDRPPSDRPPSDRPPSDLREKISSAMRFRSCCNIDKS